MPGARRSGARAFMDANVLRQTLAEMLTGNAAHVPLERAVAGLRPEWRVHRPPGLHSVWQLLEHVRLVQEDVLRYTLDATWESPDFPGGYWTENHSDLSDARWQASLERYRADLEDLLHLVRDPRLELTTRIPHGEGRTYLRQILLVADHTAYHTGQIISLRRSLGDWPPLG